MIEGKLHLTTVEGTGRQFVAQSGTGHVLVIDDVDGHSGAKPIELALLALEVVPPSMSSAYCARNAST